MATYKPSESSALGQAKCAICHTSAPKKNPYGKELKKALDASADGQFTVEILKKVESIDSDGDGWTNGDEIAAGFLPGDHNSHPSGTPPKPGSTHASPADKAGSAGGSIIPSHAFHPAVVHFPIALFLFAVLVEFVASRRQSDVLRVVALWNLTGAFASMALVAPTGIAAWLLGQHKLEGNMLIHLLMAIASLLLMAVTLAVRKKQGPDSKAYWAILLISAIVIGLTGHFGGTMVYG